jgi:hypothetical protein
VRFGWIALLAACGRLGFEPRIGGGSSAGDAISPGDGVAGGDGAGPDSFTSCAGGDSICLVSCVGTDPDCTTTCGDGTCVGNAGELCATCAGDCATMSPVCGNGACDPGESSWCFADCGPTPWTWSSDDQQLLDLVNTARTGGTMCPGTSMVVTAPALVLDPTIRDGAHEFVWEISHQQFYSMSPIGQTCNGRSWNQRAASYGNYDAWIVQYALTTTQAAVDSWLASTTGCPILMNASLTVAGPGVAFDARPGYVMVFK